MSDLMVIVFKLNNESCAIETEYIQEILKFKDISQIPDMPDYIEGVIDLRGIVVPIVNLNKKFEEKDDATPADSKVIITRINDDLVGFMVNEVSEIVKVSDENIDILPKIVNKSGNKYIKYVGLVDKKIVSILDIHNIVCINDLNAALV